MISGTPGNEFVTDTMALIIRVDGRKLGPAAKAAFNLVESGSGHFPYRR